MLLSIITFTCQYIEEKLLLQLVLPNTILIGLIQDIGDHRTIVLHERQAF